MLNSTFSDLYLNRCYQNDKGDLVPHFWNPTPIDSTPLCLFGDETLPADADPQWGVEKTLSRVLAIALEGELPVGEFIAQARKSELPEDPLLNLLLLTNERDEAAHFKSVKLASRVYNVSEEDISIAKNDWVQRWKSLSCHPIEAAAAMEVGMFLCTLGFLRLAGGRSLMDIGYRIAKDENRHIRTNRGIVAEKGYDLLPPFRGLAYENLAWIFEFLDIPATAVGADVNIDKDFMIESSRQLFEDGYAPELDDLTYFGVQTAPFEVENSKMYADRTTDYSLLLTF